MKTALQRRAFFIALFVYFNYCHYMLMTTIPFSYPPKWVIAVLYLYSTVLSSRPEDLNNHNGIHRLGRIIPFIFFQELVVLINCFGAARRFRW